jgi:Cdc6-like AAA superfamily ATPase
MTKNNNEQPNDPREHRPVTTKEGWAAFVTGQPTPVELLAPEQLAALTEAQRDAYDEARIAYHARLIVVATSTVDQVVTTGRRLTALNRGQDSARRGLVVTGESGTGKTTAIKQLGKHHELLARRRRTASGAFLPVVYVTVPPAATPKVLAAEFARFLGLPLPRTLNQVNITNAVCDLLCRLGTDLVLVDFTDRR